MTRERKLPRRKRRAPKGYLIRVSNLVYDTLNQRRRRHRVHLDQKESWDLMFRRVLGLPDRDGYVKPLIEGMLEVHTGMFILKLEDATWSELEKTAFKLADSIARKKGLKAYQPPLRMREVR